MIKIPLLGAGLISLGLHWALLQLALPTSPVAPIEITLKVSLKTPTADDPAMSEPWPQYHSTPFTHAEMPAAWQAGGSIAATPPFSPKLLFPILDDSAPNLTQPSEDTPARIVYAPELDFSAIEKAINVEIEVLIDETGLVKSSEIIRSNLSDAENDIIRIETARFLFYPAIANDKAIESKKRFEFIRDAL